MSVAETRDPYGAALSAVRSFADAGRFTPGEAIVITELAAEVGLSPTPVREALACLAGQGLIERRKGRGYFYPALKAADVIDLFELQRAFLHAALTLYPRGLTPLRKAASSVDPLDGVQALFNGLVAQCGNTALTLAHERLNERLRSVLVAEHRRNKAGSDAARTMIDATVEGRIPDLLALIESFYERRCARTPALVAELS